MPKQKTKKKPLKHSRRQHFVSQFYLAGFTDSGKKDGLLWVYDKKEAKPWRDKPENVAFQTNFYNLELPGVKPDEMEDSFHKVETKAAPVIKKIIDTGRLPIDEDYIMLIIFIASMAFRTPSFRRMYEKPIENIIKKIFLMRKSIEGEVDKEKEEINTEKISQIMPKVIDQVFHIGMLIKTVEEITPSLIHRKWSLLYAKDKLDEFVCSDNPVSLNWIKPMPKFESPGFELGNTEVGMPLNKEASLLGRYEGESHMLWALRKHVAAINSIRAIFAQRFIYSPREDFICLKRNGKIGNIDEFLKELKIKKEKEKINN